jgi:hypothetical protein
LPGESKIRITLFSFRRGKVNMKPITDCCPKCGYGMDEIVTRRGIIVLVCSECGEIMRKEPEKDE